MSINSREELIQWSLRALGHPIVTVNVTEEQLNDRLDDSLELYQEYHLEANERTYMRYQVKTEDVYNQWIPIDGSRVFGITRLIPASHLFMGRLDDTFSQLPFDIFAQMMQSGGFGSAGFNPIDLVSYSMFRQYASTVDLLLNTKHNIRYKRHSNRLYIDAYWGPKDFSESKILVDAPDGEILLESDDADNLDEKTDNIMFESELTGNKTGRPDIRVDDWLILECHKFLDPEEATGIYGDRFLKEHYKANIKYQWGQNIAKFGTLALPGGVQLNGAEMKQEAQAELDKMRQELEDYYREPMTFLIG